ncbi:MAG: T9SS type A sorting domain-containing protein, partial [Candidatus Eisenbacteria bacterium]|nr:T9SS type A sorting domain-containing protein [Candidatus Eisenbacteria bacterium]
PGRSAEDTWFQSTLVADGMVCAIDPADAQVIYADWQNGNQVKSTDSGKSWFSIQSGISGNGPWTTPIAQDQQDGNHLYTTTTSAIYRTTNGGGSWENVASHNARWIAISPVDGNIVWTIGLGNVRRSTDDGASWSFLGTFPANGLEIKIHADPVDASTAYATFGGYSTGGPHAVMTTDLGATWTDITGDFPDQPANTFVVDPARPDDWYIGSDIGVWKSTDGGVSWVPFGLGLVNAVITDLEIRNTARKLVAGSYGRGVWEIDLDFNPASVEITDAATHTLMLDPPYPQPVRDRTVFRFAAHTEQPVSLRVFDVQGRQVDSVFETDRGRGLGDGVIRTVTWSPGDVPDGVYFAVLQAGTQRLSRKLVIQH